MYTFEKIHYRDSPQNRKQKHLWSLWVPVPASNIMNFVVVDVCNDSKQYLILSKAARLWRCLKDRFYFGTRWSMDICGSL